MSVTIVATASCKSFEEDVEQTTQKELPTILPVESIKSTAAIKCATAGASASWIRVEVNTQALPPYLPEDSRSTAKATSDVDFSYTITMPGNSGTGYLKPLLKVWAGVGFDPIGASASASMGVANCTADAPPPHAQENHTRIPFIFGERLDLHLHLEATSTARLVAGVTTELAGSEAYAEFNDITIHLEDTDAGPNLAAVCSIVRNPA